MAEKPSTSASDLEHAGHHDRRLSKEELAELEPVSSAGSNMIPELSTPPEAEHFEESKEVEAPKKPNMFDPASYPDGGAEAWLCVAGAFCCLFVSFGWINCIGVFQDYYQNTLLRQYSPSTTSWIPSLEVFCMFFGGPFAGKAFDNYGPRWLLLAGTFFHVFGLMMASLATQYYQFILAQGLCSPIGACMIFYPAMSSISTWFFKKRAFAFGIVASGSSLGGVIFPIMITRLIPRIGFPWAMRTAAFMILGLLVIANLTVKSRLPPSPKPFRLMEFIMPIKERTFSLVLVASFLFFFGLFIPFNFIIVYGIHNGMSVGLAQYLVPILNAASIFGRVLPGFIADKVGRFNTMVVMTYLSAIFVLAIWLPSKSNAPIMVFSALYGFSSGAYVSLIGALVAQISDIRQIGVRTGTLFAIVSIAGLCGNPIAGALISRDHGDYRYLQIFSGVCLVVGSTFFLISRASEVGLQLKKKV